MAQEAPCSGVQQRDKVRREVYIEETLPKNAAATVTAWRDEFAHPALRTPGHRALVFAQARSWRGLRAPEQQPCDLPAVCDVAASGR